MSIVVIPCFRRADFLEVCLDHICKADEFEKHQYLFCLDYGYNPELIKIIDKYPLTAAVYHTPDFHLHLGKQSHNVLNGILTACKRSDDIVYYIEDDVLIGKDFFTFTADVVRKEDVYCCIASKSQRSEGNESDDENCYLVKENTNDYQGIGVCFNVKKFMEYTAPHCDMRYYRNPNGYVKRYFPNSVLESMWCEQDGLQRRIIEANKLKVAFSSVPRCFHAGFYGYHRDLVPDIKVIFESKSHEEKVKFIYDHVFNFKKLKFISANKDWIGDSMPVDLNTSHTKIINQNQIK